jgi:conserved oligomeric Golgi complex subunit 5
MEDTASCIQNIQALLQQNPALLPLTQATTDDVVVPYAASLLPSSNINYTLLIQDVERKLAIIDSYMNKLSRTSPEAVTQQLLALHDTSNNGMTLAALQERSLRLERQTEGFVSTAVRVETVLQKAHDTLQAATAKLSRILDIHSTLKFLLSWQFERHKLLTVYDIEDWPRDVLRMAQSLQRMDEWARTFQPQQTEHPIALWEDAQPQVQAVAAQVRRTAQQRLSALLPSLSVDDPTTPDAVASHHQVYEWNAVLQVYFHLQELPACVYTILEHWHTQAMQATRWTWSAQAIDVWTQHMETALSHVQMLDRIVQHKSNARTPYAAVLAEYPLPDVYSRLMLPTTSATSLSLLLWGRYCQALAQRIAELLTKPKEEKLLLPLYPAIHMASFTILQQFQTVRPSDAAGGAWSTNAPTTGILGGVPVEEANDGNPQSPSSFLTWTQPSRSAHPTTAAAVHGSVTKATPEWKLWYGDDETSKGAASKNATTTKSTGLLPLRRAYQQACLDRLLTPLQYMFQENVTMNEDGVAMTSGMVMLPTKYDMQRLEEMMRQELSIPVKHFGGSRDGRTMLLQLIAQCVVDMVAEFCSRAKSALQEASSPGGPDVASYIHAKQGAWSRTESLKHDCQVVTILFTLHHSLQLLPETTYVQPFRPTVLAHHTQAAQACTEGLHPALTRIDDTVQQQVLRPLCRAIHRQMSSVWTKIHSGIYLDQPNAPSGHSWEDEDPSIPSFVQKDVVPIFDRLVAQFWVHFPPIYSGLMAAQISTYMIYAYVSHVSLLRPLTESVRLHITQDLADLEMALEQFLSKSGAGNLTLSQIDQGKPYAELRAVRQMLFWTGLDTKSKPAPDVVKSLWNELWVKDVRPSTLFHYLFSFGPSTLSTPYHMKRVSASEYVQILVPHDTIGSIQLTSPGEEMAYSTVRACCDSYIQRASLPMTGPSDGDPRIAPMVMLLGPELLRRRGRH